MELHELIRRASLLLEEAEVEIPEQTAKWLWQHVSGMTAQELLFSQREQVPVTSEQQFWALIQRRVQREPLQYLLGEVEFDGMTLMVDSRVLIPRPETETLVQLAWQEVLRKIEANPGIPLRVHDLGTGSGAIAVALARRLMTAEVQGVRLLATDLSPAAIAVAKKNALLHGVSERIEFATGAGLDAIPEGFGRLDLLISNPPYIPLTDQSTLQPEVRDFEPVMALYGGEDGLTVYREIAVQARDRLAPEATLLFEVGYDQSEAVQTIFTKAFPCVTKAHADFRGVSRVVEVQFTLSS